MRRFLSLLVFAVLVVGVARDASADLTAFIGANQTPLSRTGAGVALSVSLLVVGFEFEYSDAGEDTSSGAPSLRTGMFNVQLQTPSASGLRFYGTFGGGLYRERLADRQETSFGANVGGGITVPLAGPIGIRFDYRVFALRGDPLYDRPQRFYVGFNLAF